MTKLLGPKDLRRLVERVIELNPNTRNPYDYDFESCVYTPEDGRHCIVGEVGVAAGWSIPDVDDVTINQEPRPRRGFKPATGSESLVEGEGT